MKIVVTIGVSMLGLVLGTPAFANPQHGHDDDRQEQEHSDRHHANESEHRQDQRAHEEHAQRAHEEQREHDKDRQHPQPHYEPAYQPGHKHEVHEREEHAAHHDVWQDHRAQHWEHEHHNWHERGGYRGYRIPEDRFRAHFGRAHWFRVHSAPVMVVGGYPRFQYSGFWFSVVDPWPEYWSRTWYETDDIYIDYVNDGYYMYNRSHPGVGIAISVSF